MSDSDSLYHRLFSHPRMVEELIREFVPDALAEGLDFSRLQRVNAKFHTTRRSARRREADVIWKLPTHEGSDIYLYLLIEFQSQTDWWMAVRMQVYQGLLWQQIIDELGLETGARLPPVLLIVLYNGDPRWKAPTQLSELIALPPDSPLWHWQPQVRYHLLDMSAFPEQDLARRDTLAALLFRLEQRHPRDQFERLIDEVLEWFRRHEGFESLKRLFGELVRQAMQSFEAPRPIPHDLVEMQSMLATLGEFWKEQWKAEGMEKGMAEGMAEGRAKGMAEGRAKGMAEGRAEGEAKGKIEGQVEGKVDSLIRLLTKRFGPLDPSRQGQIRSANLTIIETWFDRAIDARDVTSVFDPR